ncbi:MAG TPA: redoxin domain-containing protein [Candidatus Hydrogenedentes bacterium]|mgnify:CR=1 FL=1|nr:redoxin domain-containing protein [Candidatus Hydrogenedentota bacterium]
MIRAIVCLLLASAILTPGAFAGVEVGTKAAKFEFKDIRYVTRTLKDLGEAKAYVLVFSSTTCPVAQRYLPKINELNKTYAGKNVVFALVNAAADDSIQQMAYHAIEYKIDVPVVKDIDGGVCMALGATRTPEAVVLDADGVIRYRGRIDDQFRVSGASPNVGREDLALAIDAVLDGKSVEIPETPVEGCEITFAEVPAPSREITYAQDIVPILQKSCMPCHRDGAEAPFSLSNYDQTASKASAIAEAVNDGRMPPWYAHPDFGTWANAWTLTPDEKRTILQWEASGRPMGDIAKAPAPPTYPDTEWIIGEPDLVLTEEKTFALPAQGVIDYEYVTLPYMFPEDTWVQGIQIKPSNPRVVHHANVVYTIPPAGYKEDSNFLTGRVPGGSPAMLTDGVAFLIPKGAVLTIQVHYVTTGKPESNQMTVGLRYAKEVVKKRARHKVLSARGFTIPPGEASQPVGATKTIENDATAIALFVHMHLRGKNTKFYAHYPDGKNETLLVIPNYSFGWQMPYVFNPETAKKLPAGTKIECASQFDNSAFNPFNPDPTATVEYGPQTFHEMMDGYIFYVEDDENLNIEVDPKTGQAITKTASAVQ